MPHIQDGLYSAEALARSLSVPNMGREVEVTTDDLVRFARAENLAVTEADGAAYFERRTLSALLEKFAAHLGLPKRHHALPQYLRDCATPWATTLVRMYEGDLAWPAALPPGQGELLKTLVGNIAPQRVVEIGCFIGISSVWMAAALEEIGGEGHIHSIDLFTEIMPGPHVHHRYHSDPLSYAQEAATAASLSHRVRFHKAHSHEIQRLAPEVFNQPIDLLFIDGDHSIEGCAGDFLLYAPHVRAGGYILLHDIYPDACGCDGPRWVIDELVNRSPNFALIEIPTLPTGYDQTRGYGIAVIRKVDGTNVEAEQQREEWLRLIGRQQKTAMLRAAAKRIGFAPAQAQPGFRETQRLVARLRAIIKSSEH
jgi:predicted O-methyltransferase YrrM